MKRTLNRMAALIAIAIIPILLSLTGCGDNGTDPGNDMTLVRPKAGSFFVWKQSHYNDNGVVDNTRIDTIHVLATDQTFGGIAGLWAVKNSDQPDTLYAHYQSNGDFAILGPADTNHDGTNDAITTEIFPFGTRARVQTDASMTLGSGGSFRSTRDSALYEGEETAVMPAGSFKTHKVMHVHDIRTFNSSGAKVEHVRELQTYYFAPSTGFFVKAVFENDYLDSAGNSTKRRVTSITETMSYKLQ